MTTADDLLRACRAVYPGTDTSIALERSRREMPAGGEDGLRAWQLRRSKLLQAHHDAVEHAPHDALSGAARSVADRLPYPVVMLPSDHEAGLCRDALKRMPVLLRVADTVGAPRLALAAAFARAVLRAYDDGVTGGYSVAGIAAALEAMIVRAACESKGAFHTADLFERAAREEASA